MPSTASGQVPVEDEAAEVALLILVGELLALGASSSPGAAIAASSNPAGKASLWSARS